VLSSVVELLDSARRASVRTVNAIMTATYWEVGRRIVEYEQGGANRAEYGDEVIQRLASDLTRRFGRGFGYVNLSLMRRFFLVWPSPHILQTASEGSSGRRKKLPTPKFQTVSEESLRTLSARFPLPWSHYVRLLSVGHEQARRFYEAEALRGGWSVRQLDRQINSKFYERTALSRNKASMLAKGQLRKPEDAITPEEEIKDPLVLEFLDLKDAYSEHDLEEAIIHRLEAFLLELGSDFAFVGRQRRLRVGDQWFRIDLLFFHRRLRCLVIIDLKLSAFTPGDVGQMNMYLNYARAHWTHEGENPPVGLILAAGTSEPVVKYAMEGLTNRVLAAEYRMGLPAVEDLQREIERTKTAFEQRRIAHAAQRESKPRKHRTKRK
jgi:predicted nuclease of restriction endonuclease-like (RecB) superfamily